jgi:hypothetical protein
LLHSPESQRLHFEQIRERTERSRQIRAENNIREEPSHGVCVSVFPADFAAHIYCESVEKHIETAQRLVKIDVLMHFAVHEEIHKQKNGKTCVTFVMFHAMFDTLFRELARRLNLPRVAVSVEDIVKVWSQPYARKEADKESAGSWKRLEVDALKSFSISSVGGPILMLTTCVGKTQECSWVKNGAHFFGRPSTVFTLLQGGERRAAFGQHSSIPVSVGASAEMISGTCELLDVNLPCAARAADPIYQRMVAEARKFVPAELLVQLKTSGRAFLLEAIQRLGVDSRGANALADTLSAETTTVAITFRAFGEAAMHGGYTDAEQLATEAVRGQTKAQGVTVVDPRGGPAWTLRQLLERIAKRSSLARRLIDEGKGRELSASEAAALIRSLVTNVNSAYNGSCKLFVIRLQPFSCLTVLAN